MVETQSDVRRYRHSLADIVLDRKGEQRRLKTASDRLKAVMPYHQNSPVMKNVFNLLDSFEKYNNKTNYRFLSPKFGSVIPDKREDMN